MSNPRNEEARGSNPLSSTKIINKTKAISISRKIGGAGFNFRFTSGLLPRGSHSRSSSKCAEVNFVYSLAGLPKIPNQLRIGGEIVKVFSLRQLQILNQVEKTHINLQSISLLIVRTKCSLRSHLFFAPMQEIRQTNIPFQVEQLAGVSCVHHVMTPHLESHACSIARVTHVVLYEIHHP